MIKFNIQIAINNLVPGAKFRGDIVEHTEVEYNNLEQLDPRDKPMQNVIYKEALSELRRNIKTDINTTTAKMLEYGMTWNDGTNTMQIHLGIEEQINLDTMDRLREELHSLGEIVYPYKLKVSDNQDGEGVYAHLNSTDHLHQLFLAGISHKNSTIEEGRRLKDNLGSMSKEELESFIDPRV